MRGNSLALRLIALSALWTAVAVVAAGIVLTSLYRRTVERSFDERLEEYLVTLVGALSVQTGDFADPGNLGEPRFENIHTGWYWQVGREGNVVLASPSLAFDTLAVPASAAPGEDGLARFTATGPAGEAIRGIARSVTFEATGAFEIVLVGNATAMQGEIVQFRMSVILTLAAFSLGLILSTFVQIRWGLRPLDRVRRGLADLRAGKATRFDEAYPAEIQPLATELNALLESNQQIIERARTQVGNLAHALKTPLSVITNEARADKSALARKVSEQAELMTRQVSHYLDRARIAAAAQVIGAVTPVQPVVSRFVRAMRKIYEDKQIHISCDVADGAQFRGEQQDLEEIIGNLTDNACKYAPGKVLITVRREAGKDDSERGRLVVYIDDDGPGLTPEQAAEATRRGKRLDESKPGSGLGLSIVTELVAMYGGSLRLGASPAGGLRAEVVLPAG